MSRPVSPPRGVRTRNNSPPSDDPPHSSVPLLPTHNVRHTDFGMSAPARPGNGRQRSATAPMSNSTSAASTPRTEFNEAEIHAARAANSNFPYPASSQTASTAASPSGDFHHHSRSRNASWEMLAQPFRKIEHSYLEFDARHASQAHLTFAEGDLGQNAFAKVYGWLLNASIVTRWIIFIVPLLGVLWLPGILNLTSFPNSAIWGVKMLWWSIWATVVWVGWWGCLAVAMMLPHVARHTVGVVAVGARKYIDWLFALHRYVALFIWTLIIWISFQPLVNARQLGTASSSSRSSVDTMAKLLFSLFICAAILLGEKFSLQWIAAKFHERSYSDRIADQKFAVRVLVTLYTHSTNIPWRADTLNDDGHGAKRHSGMPRKLLKRAIRGVKFAATTTTTALGNVASEIAGSSVLQPNSPQAMVKTALESANKSRMLARRLFYSFVRPGASDLLVQDISRFFPSPEEADFAFGIFDKDMNGDITRDEMELACMEIHREQLSLEHSMRDLDSAVGRLDNILMTVYFFVVILIFAVALEAQLLTLVTSAGTFVLGLSWMIGSSVVEVLTSIIFLFVKHPFDVGDRVTITITAKTYTVKEIRLLSTVFLDEHNCQVQAPNSLLNTYFIENMRRSPQMSETFTFDVNFGTTFEDIEGLRQTMIEWLMGERRDFHPIFDVTIVDMPAQEKMTLSADIRYKSNWQQGALQAKRRNKWLCALKQAMKSAKVFGPAGDPDAIPAPDRRTLVPWDLVEAGDKKKLATETSSPESGTDVPIADFELQDKNALIMDETQDVFGETDQVMMNRPRDNSVLRQRNPSPPAQTGPSGTSARPGLVTQPEEIEMAPHSSQPS